MIAAEIFCNSGKKFFSAYQEVLLSKNERKIRAFCNRYGISLPHDERQFWLSVERATERLDSDEKRASSHTDNRQLIARPEQVTAEELTAEIGRVQHAVKATKSQYLRRDYQKYLNKLRKELKVCEYRLQR